MKKMIISLFTGAALIGFGIGITLLELRDWKISEIRTDLLDRPLQTARYERTVDMDEVDRLEIDHRYKYGHFGDYAPQTEVMYDKDRTEYVLVEIEYRGYQPRVYQSAYWENEEKVTHELWINTNAYIDGASVYDIIKSMFENKTYYTNGECSYVEKITVYTAYPDKVNI
ncbi:MAG: hypothetical protein IJ410_00355 [Oscillospiraceae bacterium]|nr:hypothetical protein [Oscillospiraceae bacterium]